MSHLIILPILWPLLVALLTLLPPFDTHIMLRRVLSVGGAAVLLLLSVVLLIQSTDSAAQLYQLGNWPAPFGISLLLDQVSSLMLCLTSVLAVAASLYASSGEDENGPFFHALLHFQLMGINGAFLTADLFNLFVFFEVLLIASYSLLIHGGGKAKTKAAVHYVILNLVGSALFLFALALIYGASGTLNMLDLGTKVAALSDTQLQLLQAAVALLLVVFGLKAAVMPLHFWLGNAYSSASPAVAALFAIMTKVGIYSLLRVFAMVLQDAGFVASWVFPVLWWTGLLTIVLGVLGALASEDLRKMASYLVIVSVGALVAMLSLGTEQSVQALLYYLVHSTLATAALFLLADLIASQRGKAGDRLVNGRKLVQPVLLGSAFIVLALSIIGMPPFSGFIGKLLLLQAVPQGSAMLWYWSFVLGSSVLLLIGLSRAGSILFWQVSGVDPQAALAGRRRSTALMLLVLASPLLSLFAGPVSSWCLSAALQLRHIATLSPGAF
jgi:multicomponent K+:H+ antiporter subunit D